MHVKQELIVHMHMHMHMYMHVHVYNIHNVWLPDVPPLVLKARHLQCT